MSKNIKKTPWINDGTAGFFEYQLDVPEIPYMHFVAREKQELQDYVTEQLQYISTDRVSTYIKQQAMKEYYEQLTKEQQDSIPYQDFLKSKLYDENYRKEIYDSLVEAKEILPLDTTIEQLGYQKVEYDNDDIAELKKLIKDFPSASQENLESIYLHHQTEYVPYLLMKESDNNALTNVENYEYNIEVSELLCQIYEDQNIIKSQLISDSEMIVDLYEKLNTDIK